jgi:hypothetical protein
MFPTLSRRNPRLARLGLAAVASLALWFPAAAQAARSQPAEAVDASGELDVVIKDDFVRQRFEKEYFLRGEAGRWYRLQFKHAPPEHLKTGQRVRARGKARGRLLSVESLVEEGAGAATSGGAAGVDSPAALNLRRVVVLMVDLANAKASTRYTLAGVTGQMYTNGQSVDGLYRQASFGQVGFAPDSNGDGAPDVFGPFAIAYDNSTCDYYGWANAAESAAQAAGINLSLYQHRVFILPRYSDLPACSWAGLANVGCGTFCRAWIAEAESGMVIAHELGHNLNMAHAATDPENDGVVNAEYGDYSDPMGLSRSWHVFNAGHLDQMGWLASFPGNTTTVSASGTYDLAPIGPDPTLSSWPEILKIAKPNTNEVYYLSYRQPAGYDTSLGAAYTGGVNVHRYRGSGYGLTHHIKTLADGGSFSDEVNGITVTQIAHASGFATVRVDFGCAAATPAVSLTPATAMVRPGAPASYSVLLSNADSAGCSGTVFDLAYAGTPSATIVPASQVLAGGEAGVATLSAQTTLADGNYSLQVRAVDSDGGAPAHPVAGVGSASLLVDATPPTVPTGLRGSVDRKGKVSLSWSASTDSLSGVTRYQVIRNASVIATVTGTTYTDTTAPAGTTSVYQTAAVDGVGNLSASSSPLSVTVGASRRSK